MKVSKKGIYAIRLMTEVAKCEAEFITISSLASKTGISDKYLEQIVSKLLKANLLVSFRGANGGYKLSKPSNSIALSEILNATEGTLKSVNCMEKGAKCDYADKCLNINIWAGLNKVINDYFSNISLEDVVQKRI